MYSSDFVLWGGKNMRVLNALVAIIGIPFFVIFITEGKYISAILLLIGEFFCITTVLWGENAPNRAATLIAKITNLGTNENL